jgi:hypothetical protein
MGNAMRRGLAGRAFGTAAKNVVAFPAISCLIVKLDR